MRATVRVSMVTQTFNVTKNISNTDCWEKLNTRFLDNVNAVETVRYVNIS
jgi:hypothetical protein